MAYHIAQIELVRGNSAEQVGIVDDRVKKSTY